MTSAPAKYAHYLADFQSLVQGPGAGAPNWLQDLRDTGWGSQTASVRMVLRNSRGQESTREMRNKLLEMEGGGRPPQGGRADGEGDGSRAR